KKSAKGGEDRGSLPADIVGDEDRGSPFEHIAQEGCGREALATGAKNVGGANVAGANRADVLRAGKPRQNDAEWDRAQQIASDERGRVISKRPTNRRQHGYTYSYTVLPATIVRTTRPCILASSNGVFLHLDLRSARSSTHGTSMSTTMTSAGLPGRNVPPEMP